MPVPLIVTAAVLAALLILFSLRLHLVAGYDGELHAALHFAGLTFRLEGRSAKAKAPRKPREAKEKKKPDIRQFLRLFKDFAGSVKHAARAFLRRLRIDRLRVDITVCGEDAAATAVTFGEACAAVYGGLGVLASCIPVRRHEITIRPLYTEGENRAEAECDLSIRLGALLWVALSQSARFLILFLRRALAARQDAGAAVPANRKEGVTHE